MFPQLFCQVNKSMIIEGKGYSLDMFIQSSSKAQIM